MVEEIFLVKAKLDDWQKVLEFERSSKSKLFAAWQTEAEVKKYLSNSEVYFIKLGEEFIGTVSFKSKNTSVEMDGLIVSPLYRGKGYAKFAFNLIMKKVKKFKRAHLKVHPQNTSAVLTYLNEGFQIVGWEENPFGDNEPRLLLEKYLKKK